jgi:UDP-hydrolysing UDP-N-acetyl-D-glucosamine 2-epimerase
MVPKDDSNYSMSVTLGNGITQFSKIFNNLKPDINVILGDRDEMLASTIAAYHMNIPNAHIHGGDKSKGGIDEYNRHAITKMSNIHFAVSQQSKKRILRMGEDPKFVFLTGSPSIDEIKSKAISDKKTLMEKYSINFSGKEILLVQHPVTTETKKSKIQIQNTLAAINKFNNTIIAILPNSDPGRESIQKELKIFSKKNKKFYLFNSLPREDYLGMIKNSGVLVGNSSSGMIEASYFSTPVVNIGIRQQDRERGKNVINVEKVTSTLIYKAILKALNFGNKNKSQIKQVYGNGNASKKIVKHLEKISLDEQLIKKQISY